MSSVRLSIDTSDPALRARAEALRIERDEHAPLTLAMRDDGLELRDADARPGRGLRVDFAALAHARRSRIGLSKRQPLARAVGVRSRQLIDATAGLGGDAALLAAMGFEVTALERDPVLFALLDDAMERVRLDDAASAFFGDRLRFVHADARRWLATADGRADCMYLDPMFPHKRKASALPRKEIRLVRALAGDDDDAAELLAIARRRAPRVAVKRPTHAPPLAPDLTATIGSKLVRYDIYASGEVEAG